MLKIQSFGNKSNFPDLLIVHGLFGSGRNWRAIARNISADRQVHIVDMRNHGESFWNDDNSYESMAEDLKEVISSLEGPVDVLGHSMGGKAGKTPKFVCASAGNHAQGFAYACQHFGVKGRIYMPVTTPQQKITKTASFGGNNIEIIMQGDYFDETLKAAEVYSDKTGAEMLPPFDHLDVIEGQASVGVEILNQLETPT